MQNYKITDVQIEIYLCYLFAYKRINNSSLFEQNFQTKKLIYELKYQTTI